jgi:hypothetical protein
MAHAITTHRHPLAFAGAARAPADASERDKVTETKHGNRRKRGKNDAAC